MSHQIDLPELSVDEARVHLGEVVAVWRGHLDGEALAIPSQSGLRRGVVEARVSIERLGAHGSRIELVPTASEMHIHTPSLLMLLAGAVGGIGIVLWPFVPRLTPAMPMFFLFSIGAWFLVASRLGEVGLAELAKAIERELGEASAATSPGAE